MAYFKDINLSLRTCHLFRLRQAGRYVAVVRRRTYLTIVFQGWKKKRHLVLRYTTYCVPIYRLFIIIKISNVSTAKAELENALKETASKRRSITENRDIKPYLMVVDL